MPGSQDFETDPRNETALVWLNGALVPRSEARVSLFDAGFGMGDGVWEGLRLHRRRLLFLEAHLDRLLAGAAAIRLDIGLSRVELTSALEAVVAANAMTDGAHLRLMVTRGVKATINQDPRNALGQPTIAITAEHKRPTNTQRGLALATVAVRCTPADMFDMRLNSHSRLNLITALLEAIDLGADEALMLDPQGFVSSCNATNFFFVSGGEVKTSAGACCFNGITRGHVIELCRRYGVPLAVGDFSPEAARAADEAFVTGTLGGITPVRRLDGVEFAACPGSITSRLAALYEDLKDADAAR
ncbi:MAG: aminotransferase class IV [Caulobacteraceae bacterium]|jgi:branched-chain amino acid aminotransferase